MENEFDWLKKVQPQKTPGHLIQGIGDDAALYQSEASFDEVATVDTMVEDVHFKKSTMSPTDIGYKALAINLSDIAAMGGKACYYLVSIAIPQSGWTEDEVVEIYAGMKELANRCGAVLIGGDTVSTNDRLVVTVTVIGRVETGRKLLRSNAKPGDIVFVTGPLGSSAAGLHLLLKGDKRLEAFEYEAVVRAHQRPEPQLDIGRVLAKSGFRVSLNDVSDGIASEAHEIAEASGVVIDLFEGDLPYHESLDDFPEQKWKWILSGGEDFQLLGTIARDEWDHVKGSVEGQGGEIYAIGEVKEGESSVYLHNENGIHSIDKSGYQHFG
ncbi:thiamine-phosphate kinase [Texcoconibacillus texcoconensis]|uniref:Thiamine-monophosphate kinase n=1 Tax=Texcoconibacillus texcoconensis TaxID=1095777 RepID=A0A840QMS3_9BACI|nr:thiamine-phosphate kinase [Texcoconibacillus texcoconensis]MBB5172630.1 thiamine-monophosphate kinase [Texcoconibacillus texcoconensis]